MLKSSESITNQKQYKNNFFHDFIKLNGKILDSNDNEIKILNSNDFFTNIKVKTDWLGKF